MPKVVNPEERREQIADAVFDLIVAGGVEQASLRNVAEQAGLNIGSVRHYVDGHQGMLIDAVQVMGERVAARITACAEAFFGSSEGAGAAGFGRLESLAVDMLEQLLPLTAESRREVAVWLAFTERSRVDPELATVARQLLGGSRDLARMILGWVEVSNLEQATELLASTVDGLTIAALHDPDQYPRERVRELLAAQLRMCLRRD